MGVRPARVAVLLNSSDADWKETCLRITEFFTTVWGGKRNIIVPTDGKSISQRFWHLLEAFDPDYIYQYRKSLEDMKVSSPARYEELVDRGVSEFNADHPGGDDEYTRPRIDEMLVRRPVDSFAVSQSLQDELKSRLAPLYFQEHVLHSGWIGASSEAFSPLTNVAKILKNCDAPGEVTELKPTFPDVPELWHCSVTGRLRSNYAEALREAGIRITVREFAPDQISDYFNFVMRSPMEATTPFQASMLQLSEYVPLYYGRPAEPVVVVVGDTLEDFCLFQCLSRLRYGVSWLLPSWLDSFRSGSARAREGGAPMTAPEFYAFHYGHTVLNSTRPNAPQRKIVFVSASMALSQVEAHRTGLNEATILSQDPIERISEASESILELINKPIRVFESNNVAVPRSQLFVNQETPGFFETPKPERFKVVDPHEHRWMVELAVKGHALPRHPELGTFVIRSGAMSTLETRVGTNGPVYFCPNALIISGVDIDQVLVKPTVFLPGALDIVQHVARVAGLSCKISDKGYFLAETIRKFGGIEKLGVYLQDSQRRAVLNKFLDRSRPGRGILDEGVFLSSDGRRYMNFSSIHKILCEEEKLVRDFIDGLVRAGIFYIGFIFKCAFCRNADWFSVDEITHEFKCKRCARVQIYTSEQYRDTREPSWFYKLDEIAHQGLANNMTVPALALYYMSRVKHESFIHTTELEFSDQSSGKPVAEIDICCIQDGVLSIGEAKKDGALADNAADDDQLCTKYLELAKKLCARKVVFATLAPSWSQRATQSIQRIFQDSLISYELLTSSELGRSS